MRRLCVTALAVCMLTGCSARLREPYRRQADDLALLRVVGVDATDNGVELTVTAEGVGDEPGEVLSARSATLAGAMCATRERYVFYGHVDRLVLGEALVGQGIGPVLDCLARDGELGPDCRLWVVRGRAAQAVGAVSGLSRRLEQLERGVDVPGAGDAMGVLAREGSLWLPALAVVEQDGQMSLQPAGYAIVRKGLLVSCTDLEGSRGLELFTGAAQSKVVELTVPNVGVVSLSLERVRMDCQPCFDGGALVGLEVVCHLEARVVQTPVPLQAEDLEWLVYELEWQQGKGLARVLEQAQYWDADFLELEYRARKGSPSRAAEISEQWPQVFRDLDIRVTALAAVERPSA